MEINRNNYEIFFLDYKEGNLNSEHSEQLKIFLNANPDLLEEFENFELIALEPEQNQFNFEGLKKEDLALSEPINKNNYNNYFIAYHEQDLSQSQIEEVENFIIDNPITDKDFRTFALTKLLPDELIQFPNKSLLKKKTITLSVFQYVFYSTAIAASLLILINLFFNNPENIQSKALIEKGFVSLFDRPNINLPIVNKTQNSHEIAMSNSYEGTTNKINAFDKSPINPMKSNVISDIPVTNYDNTISQRLIPSIVNTDMLAAAENPSKANNLENNEKNYLNSIAHWAVSKVKSKVNPTYEAEPIEPLKITGWDLANLGLTGINSLTESNFKISRNLDNNGNLASYSFSGNNFEFSKSLK